MKHFSCKQPSQNAKRQQPLTRSGAGSKALVTIKYNTGASNSGNRNRSGKTGQAQNDWLQLCIVDADGAAGQGIAGLLDGGINGGGIGKLNKPAHIVRVSVVRRVCVYVATVRAKGACARARLCVYVCARVYYMSHASGCMFGRLQLPNARAFTHRWLDVRNING